jgi:hypothetical protein
MRPALGHHRALAAHLLCLHFALGPSPAALTIGMEEHRRFDAPAVAL